MLFLFVKYENNFSHHFEFWYILSIGLIQFFFQAEMKQTNTSRAMVADLVRGLLPSTWRRYTVAPACTVIQVLFIILISLLYKLNLL